MEITVSVDDRATQDALTEWRRRAIEAARKSAHEGAAEIEDKAVSLGSVFRHPFQTKTPSPPGAPAGFISGHLVDSYRIEDDPANFSAQVGPTADYARIQELGGKMTGHPYMVWQEPPGTFHKSSKHSLPARPTLKPAVEAAIPGIAEIVRSNFADIQANL